MTTTAAETPSTVLPPEDLEPMLDLSRFLARTDGPAALVGPDGQVVDLPAQVFDVVVDVVRAMERGKAITIAPVDQMLTTQEAADFLGVSRPTVVKLLESGRIPFAQPGAGRHRRVRLEDVVEYQRQTATERASILSDMTADAVDLGLYDGPADYGAALRRARHGRD